MPKQLSVRVDLNVPVPMRDGTVLYADIVRPDASGRYPALVSRTPYGKRPVQPMAAPVFDPVLAASNGYVVVVQDTRGRNASEGEFYPFRDEFSDGYDTIEWAAAEPWCNGRVGMFGGSYLGWTQWTAAASRPPSLRAIMPNVTWPDPHRDFLLTGGALCLANIAGWAMTSLALPQLPRTGLSDEEQARATARVAWARDHWQEALSALPLRDLAPLAWPGVAPYFNDWLSHPDYDDYWASLDIEARFDQITVPAFNMGGWYDLFLWGTLRNYVGMAQRGGNDVARSGQKLLIGPWRHGQPASLAVCGEIDFGPSSVNTPATHHMRWFDYWLKEIDTGILNEPPVRVFMMGDGGWRTFDSWPPPEARFASFYLHSDGRANSLYGDGTLSMEPPGAEPPDMYLYDPRNPVPTRGGPLLGSGGQAGPFDQRPNEVRGDVLVYSTPPLSEPLAVCGPVTVTLWAVSSAPDTDFTAKLIDVYPDGRAYNLTDGIVRARYRESRTQSTLIEPGKPYQYTIDLYGTGVVFQRGHQIRLEVSSSNFPRFDRNPNTGAPLWIDAELRPAVQTILHDDAHPSCVTLPVVPLQ